MSNKPFSMRGKTSRQSYQPQNEGFFIGEVKMGYNFKDKECVKEYYREYSRKWYQRNKRRYKNKICEYCHKKFDTFSKDARFCSNVCSGYNRTKDFPHKYKEQNGYILIYVENHPCSYKRDGRKMGYVREHRLVMEKELGRYLKSNEIVHHLNGIKDDNRLENLVICCHSTHASYIKKLQERIRELENNYKNY